MAQFVPSPNTTRVKDTECPKIYLFFVSGAKLCDGGGPVNPTQQASDHQTTPDTKQYRLELV